MSIALMSAISGLSALQQMLDVVGGNISNASTPGYKAENIAFKELMTQEIRPPSAPNGHVGSVNPSQIGTGVQTASISQNYTPGGLSVTGRPSDMAINGDGFFALRDFSGGLCYTRAGNFTLDRDGYLTNPNGLKLQGWTATNGTVDIQAPIGALQVPMGRATIARQTSTTGFEGNLDASADVYSAGPPASGGYYSTDMMVYDSLGSTHTVNMLFTRNASQAGQGGNWSWTGSEAGVAVGTGTVVFLPNGNYDPASSTPAPQLSITPTDGAGPMSISVDLSGVTQVAGISTVLSRTQDGFPPGQLQGYSISQDGTVTGAYSNGLKDVLGKVALATCANNEGLERGEGGLLRETSSSGPILLSPGQGNSFTSGALESSNVDIGLEFTNMIVAQRAFQANARMVTTMDQILNELTHLRG